MSSISKDIEAVRVALSRYDNLSERFIPWKGVKDSLVDFDKIPEKMAVDISAQIGRIKTDMTNGIDQYFDAFPSMSEWANLTASHLTMFVELFNANDAEKARQQKQLLIEMLDKSVAQMSATQTKLDKSALSFKSAGGVLTVIRNRFGPKFYKRKEDLIREHIRKPIFGLGQVDLAHLRYLLDQMGEVLKKCDHFYEKFKEANKIVAYAKDILATETQHISYLRKRTEQTVRFVDLDAVSDLRATVIESAQSLISKCAEYQTKYANLQ